MLRVLKFKTTLDGGKPVDWVELASADAMGETGEFAITTWTRIDKLRPPERMGNSEKKTLMEIRWSHIEPHYEAWRKGHAIPETGTPLGAWHGVTAEQAERLRAVGIATVEGLAELTENQLAKPVLPNLRRLKEQAALWLEGASDAEKDRRIAELEERLNAAMDLIEQATAAVPAEGDKPRRGRPPKAQAEGEAAAEAAA